MLKISAQSEELLAFNVEGLIMFLYIKKNKCLMCQCHLLLTVYICAGSRSPKGRGWGPATHRWDSLTTASGWRGWEDLHLCVQGHHSSKGFVLKIMVTLAYLYLSRLYITQYFSSLEVRNKPHEGARIEGLLLRLVAWLSTETVSKGI
jgi:hypothetical protein